jgi:mono/diheme cytochrome c family protein
MLNRTILSAFAVFFGAALLAACQPADSTSSANDNADPLWNGRQHYEQYCQSCHGGAGAGDGPIAELLKVGPPDLTMIQVNNGGNFPVDQLAAWIDGRNGIESHGSREMPVWGNIWTDEDGGAEAEQRMTRQINELIEYIRSIQVSG